MCRRSNEAASKGRLQFFINLEEVKRNVGVNANYLSHASNSVISSSLAIRFTEDVVIPRNRATDTPVYPNFRTAT
jgi:hypothetical protein